MASEMVERVARRMWDDWCGLYQNPRPMVELPNWDDLPDDVAPGTRPFHIHWCHTFWRNAARAAIEAMREPTIEMITAGSDDKRWGREHFDDQNYAPVGNIWIAMIDAALKD